ncbi:MAG: Cell division protein ZapA [Pseudomonadota bacterium]|jgi:cell division protein ZapA (FtsZ GTPase activity inhibitor)
MTSADNNLVHIQIGEQTYALRIHSGNQAEVNAAITMVSEGFKSITASGKINNPERIAVMVALNIAMESQKYKQSLNDLQASLHQNIV